MWVNNAAYYCLLVHLIKKQALPFAVFYFYTIFNFPKHIKMLYLKICTGLQKSNAIVCIWKTVLFSFILSTLCNIIIQCTGLKTREKIQQKISLLSLVHSKQRSQIKARLRPHAQSADFLMTSVPSAQRSWPLISRETTISAQGCVIRCHLITLFSVERCPHPLFCSCWCFAYGVVTSQQKAQPKRAQQLGLFSSPDKKKETLPTCAENHSVYTFLLKSGHGYNTALRKRNHTFS